MQVSVETTSGLERRLTVGIPAERVEGEVNQRLRGLAKSQRLDGFRPGKIPLKVIQARFGKRVRDEVLGELIRTSFYEAVMKEKLQPAGGPSIEEIKGEPGQDVEFVAAFEVYPEVAVSGFDAIEVERPVAEVKDSDIDAMLETLRKQQSSWKEVERAAENDEQIVIDFKGSIDGEAFEGGEAQDFPVTLGSGGMIPGFEEGLTGKKAGDEFELDVTFPEDYQAEHLAGKKAQFAVVVKSVKERELPELNEEFAERFGVTEGGMDALRSDIRKNMERELRQVLRSKVKAQVMDGLIKNNDLDVPGALVQQEMETLRKDAIRRFSQGRQLDPKDVPNLPDELFKEEAERRVKLGLLMSEIIKEQELKPDADKVRAAVEEMAEAYEQPQEVINYYYGDKERLKQVESMVLEDQVVDLVLNQAKLTDKEVSFDEVMNKK